MSVENAKKFLEHIAAHTTLQGLLKDVSMQDLEQTLEENHLDDVTGGINILLEIYGK